jgi:DNA mismatch repair ATPase MutL
LKSAQTESNYIIDVFINFALINYDKKFVLIKDGKTYFNFDKKNDQLERVFDIYKKEWEKNLKIIGEV